MDFAFDFGEEEAEQPQQQQQQASEAAGSEAAGSEAQGGIVACQTIEPRTEAVLASVALVEGVLEVPISEGQCLRIVRTRDLSIRAEASIVQRTDVKKDVYEGGFKLWEGAEDLARFLHAHPDKLAGAPAVLDLGCGHGVPGIFAMTHGAASVCFQDLNSEVLERQTMLNVALNVTGALPAAKEEEAAASGLGAGVEAADATPAWSKACKFVSGDWRLLAEELGAEARFDLILTAETVYASDMFPVMADLLARLLAPNGTALVAGKRFYFGVGGGLHSFREFLEARGGFVTETAQSFEDGSSNIRDILGVRLAPAGSASQ